MDAEIRDEFDELACYILGITRFNELRNRGTDRSGILASCVASVRWDRERCRRVEEAVREALDLE